MTSDITIQIACDPETDLTAAGYDRDEADSLYDAWSDAADELAKQLGLDVRTSRGAGPETSTDIGDETLERALWQAAHDAIRRDADGEWSVGAIKASSTLRDAVDRVLREEDITRAHKRLDAEEEPAGLHPTYVYRDDATGCRYRVTSSDLAEYGAMLRREEEDAYSLWCAQTQAEQVEDAA